LTATPPPASRLGGGEGGVDLRRHREPLAVQKDRPPGTPVPPIDPPIGGRADTIPNVDKGSRETARGKYKKLHYLLIIFSEPQKKHLSAKALPYTSLLKLNSFCTFETCNRRLTR